MGFDVKNKKCAVCSAYLFEDDDVVCCPTCGAPHHRDCYSAIGRCGLEHLHGTDLQYSQAQETHEEKTEEQQGAEPKGQTRICTQCGKDYPKDARFCPFCGYSEMTGLFTDGNFQPFNIVDDDTDIGEGVTAKEASGIIMINHFRYISRFIALSKKKKASWNWAGFILPGCWFAYRKMYKESIVAVFFSIIGTILSIPFSFALAQLPVAAQNTNIITYCIEHLAEIGILPLSLWATGLLVNLLVRLFSALYGDWFYKNRVIKAASEIKKAEKTADSEEMLSVRKKWSGVSFLGFMAAFFAMEFIPNIILMFMV